MVRGKRKAESEPEPNPQSTKKHKMDRSENLFDNFSFEIIQNIIVLAGYSNLGPLCQVCRRFNAATKYQSFWRSMAISSFGSGIIPLRVINIQGTVEYDSAEYLLPTFSDGDKKYIDWTRYYKLRHAIGNMVSAVEEHLRRNQEEDDYMHGRGGKYQSESSEEEDNEQSNLQNDEEDEEMPDDVPSDEGMADEVPRDEGDDEIANDVPRDEGTPANWRFKLPVDACTTSIIQLLNTISPELCRINRPRRLLGITLAFIIEILPLLIEAGMHKRVKQCVYLLCGEYHSFYFGDSKQIFFPQTLAIYELVKYNRRFRVDMMLRVNSFLNRYAKKAPKSEVQSLVKRLVTEIVEFYLNGTKENDDEDSDYDPFDFGNADYKRATEDGVESDDDNEEEITYDISDFSHQRKSKKYLMVDCMVGKKDHELEDFVFEMMQKHFDGSDDFEAKAFALQLVDFCARIPQKHADILIRMAREAASTSYEGLVHAGYVILCKITREAWAKDLSQEQVLKIFDMFSEGIAARPPGGLFFIIIIMDLVKKPQWIDDDRLDRLNENILQLLAQPMQIFNMETQGQQNLWKNFCELGTLFGARLKKYLPRYGDAIIKLAGSKIRDSIFFARPKPLVPNTRILHQYARLGKNAIGEEFEPEIDRLVAKVLDKSIGFEINLAEFQALFDEACYRAMINGGKILELIDSLIKVVPSHFERFGESRRHGENFYPTECVPFIPLTLHEYKEAVKQYRKIQANPDKKAIEEIFQFADAAPRIYEIDEDRRVGSGYGGMPKSGFKYTQYHPEIVQFNPYNDREIDHCADEMTIQAEKEVNMNAMKRLVKIYQDYPEKFSLGVIQHFLRKLLGFIRAEIYDLSFYDTAIKLYERLSPLLSEQDKENYIEVFSFTIQDLLYSRQHSRVETDRPHDAAFIDMFLRIHRMVVDFIECSTTTTTNLIEYSLNFTRQLSLQENLPKKYQSSFYSLVKRLLKYSPRKMYQACRNAQIKRMVNRYDGSDDICVIAVLGRHFGVDYVAVLGYQFGVHYVKTLLPSTKLRQNFLPELHVACVNWLESNKTKTEEQIADVERFVVLLAACSINDELKHLCVYNSVLFDENMFLSAIKNDKFDTKIKSLNERVKKWTSIKDMFDIDSL